MEEDIKEAIGWLSALDPGSEYGATNKEIILSRLEQLEKENIRLRFQDIPYLEGYIKGQKTILEEVGKENKELKEMLQNRIKYTRELEADLFEKCSNHIVPKSVIREKIEELEQNVKDFVETDNTGRFRKENCRDYDKLLVLKELLGGSNERRI